MNYIYDIVLNFQNNYYNFFEWNRTDKIKNISKIPVFRVSDDDILNLKYNKIQLEESFIAPLKDENKKHRKIMFLVSNTKISLGLLLNEEGVIQKRSSLIFEEEAEVNDFCQTLSLTTIPYLKNVSVPVQDKLRIEIERKSALVDYISHNEDIFTLKYLYYEYFKEEEENLDQIKNSLLQEVNKTWSQKQNNLYNIVNLLKKSNYATK